MKFVVIVSVFFLLTSRCFSLILKLISSTINQNMNEIENKWMCKQTYLSNDPPFVIEANISSGFFGIQCPHFNIGAAIFLSHGRNFFCNLQNTKKLDFVLFLKNNLIRLTYRLCFHDLLLFWFCLTNSKI